MAYLHDKFLTLYHGDCRHMVEIPDNSVHCVVTSPPYLSKRIYKIEPLVWGGQKDCPHEWGNEIIHRDRGTLHGVNAAAGNTLSGVSGVSHPQGQFCQLCGAWRGHLGLEPSPDLYIQHLIEIFREVKRVLRPDGCLFVNLSDTHWGGKGQSAQAWSTEHLDRKTLEKEQHQISGRGETRPVDGKHDILHPGDLIGIPWRFALAMGQDGWHLRQDIIWQKPAPMPESVNGVRWERHRIKTGMSPCPTTQGHRPGDDINEWIGGSMGNGNHQAQWADCPGCPECAPNDGLVLRRGNWRPTASHEYIFMFSKSDHYYADREAVKELKLPESIQRETRSWNGNTKRDYINGEQNHMGNYMSKPLEEVNSGRNKRSVWTIRPEPFSGAHFATFPTEIPSICIKASTSEAGVCPKCGSQWARVTETKYQPMKYPGGVPTPISEAIYKGGAKSCDNWPSNWAFGRAMRIDETLGWRATCKCGETTTVPATILDPFAGTFSTGEAAVKLGRRAIGYELSEQYCKLAVERNKQGGLC